MDKKRLIPLLCAACGILAGIGMIFAAVLEDAFPKPLRVLIAIGFIANAIGILYNFNTLQSKDKDDK